MCFFAKQRYIAAIACLKRALYLAPFEWIVAYNLGLVHLSTAQHASAFHYFSSAVNLRPAFAHTYMWLGVALAALDDADNACFAFERAIEKDASEPSFHLNYGRFEGLGVAGVLSGARAAAASPPHPSYRLATLQPLQPLLQLFPSQPSRCTTRARRIRHELRTRHSGACTTTWMSAPRTQTQR